MGGNPYQPQWVWHIQILKLAGVLRRRDTRRVRWGRRTGLDLSILGQAPRLV